VLALAVAVGALVGCEATAEDIERWKGTQRGPAKITAVVVDDRYSEELRARAAMALVEIAGWDHFNAAFERLSREERQAVIHAMVPGLVEMYASGAAATDGQGPTDAQVNAKDAMADLYPMAAAEDQAALQEPLLDWATSDFNGHFLPGRRSIAVITAKVGAPAATALARILTEENVVVAGKVAALIKEHGNAESKLVASTTLAKTAASIEGAIRPSLWTAMAAVCGPPVRQFTLSYAARTQGDVDSQINALACVLNGGAPECRPGCTESADIEGILAIAENEQQDERIRAAAFDTLREHGTKQYLSRFLKLIDDRDARYRATGVDIAASVGGGPAIAQILEKIGSSRERWPWKLSNARTGNQEYGLCNMGLGLLEQAEGIREASLAGLTHSNAFVRGGAANMLGVVGTADDIPQLQSLANDRARLPGWEPDRVGAQARQAIQRISDGNRPADVSARRSLACGL
jgi:hypothetical protein